MTPARSLDRSVDTAIANGNVDETRERLALLKKRDDILEMLRCEVAAKIDSVAFKPNGFSTIDAWLLDLSNNIAMGLQ